MLDLAWLYYKRQCDETAKNSWVLLGAVDIYCAKKIARK
jgi:hypothetical protein